MVDKYIDKEGVEKKFMELRFIDSFKFMATSLDSLTKILVGRGQTFGLRNIGNPNISYLQGKESILMNI